MLQKFDATNKYWIIAFNQESESFSSVDISAIYDIEYNAITKFFLAKDSTGWYGVLYENNTTDRKRIYKVDLDTLALTALREVSATTDQGTYLEQVGVFSDTGTIVTRGGSGANGDEGGGQWMQINSL